MTTWLNEIERYAEKNVKILLIGNKFDLNDLRTVDYDEAQVTHQKLFTKWVFLRMKSKNFSLFKKLLANKFNIQYLETSAKESINIEHAFINMANLIKNELDNSENLIQSEPIKVKSPRNGKKIKKCWRS